MNPFHDPYTGRIPFGEQIRPAPYKNRYNVVGDKIVEVCNITVFRMSNLDIAQNYHQKIPEIVTQWKATEAGVWVLSKAVEPPVWHRFTEPVTYTENFAITARLIASDVTFWKLKWANSIDLHSRL
jgi:hypothetical protein